ncbi:sulfotransferase family protein [Streptomyces sp. NPDC046831]|uniref:sulfotransferase-like domain-containing protein n=1 Tax=Streptomyces sp. NPDC046831 TaxID=3154805 RepID=UPI0033D00408
MTDREPPRILALWSAPRSRSTAFLRMMAERGDYTVVHEPFSHVADFGEADVAGRTVRSESELITALRELSGRTPVFFKDTTDFHYPVLLADTDFLAEAEHTFIIRHPREIVASHYALNPGLTRDEIGVARLGEIHDAVAARTGRSPVVVDSDDLLASPEGTVRAYCAAVGIGFRPEALNWKPGLREEWRSTRAWHESTSRTSGFTKVASSYADTVDNNPRLAEFADYHLPYYLALKAGRIPVPGAGSN